jgi:hypothetical protein
MKEARYLIRLAQSGDFTPTHLVELKARVLERVVPLGGSTLNLRVSRHALEFDLFCAPSAELHPFLNALESMGKILTYKRLDIPPALVVPAQVLAEARQLYKEERFWEVHEVLEGLWKAAKGSEKQLLQGLILIAAAFVHVQKNEPHVAGPMLEDALARLQDQPAIYFGVDINRLQRDLKKIIATKSFAIPVI